MQIMDNVSLTDTFGNFMIGADTANVDKHIEDSFVDAWRRCVKVMPRTWFKQESFAGNQIVPDLPAGTGYVELPANFYLLSKFKMNGWAKAVYEVSVENERTASLQSNEYTRGSTMRPACTISSRYVQASVIQTLNYYSLPKGLTGHTIEEAIYIPVAGSLKDLSDNSELCISDKVAEPLAYFSASTVFTILQKPEIAAALDQRAAEMFPGLQSVSGNSITVKQ